MEDRTEKQALDTPIKEAIEQSNYAFIIGRHSVKKTRETANLIKHKTKVILIKRTLNYSVL